MDIFDAPPKVRSDGTYDIPHVLRYAGQVGIKQAAKDFDLDMSRLIFQQRIQEERAARSKYV